ncbi:MAG: GNAT family N-acetyltransferase [Thermoleophilia bacterium]
MERLRCQIRSRRATDDSMLVLLAAESLRPLAETRGRGADYRDADVVALLQSAEVFVAECESNIAGYIAVTEELPDLAIELVCVNPAYEARGVAHQLLDWVEGLAFSHHVAHMTTLVAGDDQRALHFFAGRGFAPQPSEGGMVVLEKRLPDVTVSAR